MKILIHWTILPAIIAIMAFASTAMAAGPKVDKLFRDAALTNEDYIFSVGESVYARASNLITSRGYKLEARNASGVSVYLGSCRTGATTATDSYTPTTVSNATDWTWVLHEWSTSNCSSGALSEDSDNTKAFNVARASVYANSALTILQNTFGSLPVALSGTVSKTNGATTLTGSGTAFLSQISVGQVIAVPHTGGRDVRRVTAITSNTILTVNDPWQATSSNQTASRLIQAYVTVAGLQQGQDWSVTWILPGGATACANTGQNNRPNSSASGALPDVNPAYLEYVPSDNQASNWNDERQYAIGPCPLFSTSNQGIWQIRIRHDPTHYVVLDLSNSSFAPPRVASIVRASSNPTNSSAVSWTVTFDKNVTGVDASDFTLVNSGLGGSLAISSVTGSGAVYTVTVSDGAGTGNLGLNVVDDDSIADGFGNKLGGTGSGNGNFTGEVYSVDRTLTPHVTVNNKTYDGNAAAAIGSRTFSSNLTVTENVSLAGGSAAFSNKNVGVGKAVNATGLSLTGIDASKYVLSSTTASAAANITARAITVSAIAESRQYDGSISSSAAPAVTSGSLAAGDSGSFTQSFDSKNVGANKTLAPSGSVNDGNSGGNYSVSLSSVSTGAITAKLLTGSITVNDKEYDGNASAVITACSVTGIIGSDDVSCTGGAGTFDNRNVGTGKTVIATGTILSGNDSGNYSVNAVTGSANISAKPILVVAMSDSKHYDGTISSSCVPTIMSNLVGGDTSGFSQVFNDPNPGSNKVLTPIGSVNDGNSGLNYDVTRVNNTGMIGWSIVGHVRYGTPNSSATKYVSGVVITGSGTPQENASSDSSGQYDLMGIGSGPYTVTASKSGDVNGISSFDAALVARHVVGLVNLSPNQRIAADASNNGTIS